MNYRYFNSAVKDCDHPHIRLVYACPVENKVPGWTFLSNHGHVLVLVAKEPGIRISELGARVGITERSARSLLRDLEESGYLTRAKVGRRNQYQVHPEGPLRHPEESTALVADLLEVFLPAPGSGSHAG